MELKGTYRFAGPAERVWDLLMDTRTLAACLPGCSTFESIGEDKYRVVFTARVAAVTGSFEGTVQMADKQPPTSYRLIVAGSGRPGFAKGECDIRLIEDGADVIVDVAGESRVGGLIAQVGQRLLGATAKMMLDRFFHCLQEKNGT